MPGGLKLGQSGGLGLKGALIEAAPLFAAMAAGYSSGRGPYAYLDQGIAGIEKRQKTKRDEEAAANAAAAFSGLMRPGGLGGARGGAPLSYTPPQPLPKMGLGMIGGGQAGIGFDGQPGADSGVMGDRAQLGFSQAPDMTAYRNAIASIESGGNYAAVGPTNPKLGRALGKYQIMEANIGPWSQEVLGRAVTPEEFLANPQLQDAIFDAKFGEYAQKFGLEGAAQAWFAGPGGVGKTGRQDVLGTSVGDYGQRFVQALGADGSQRIANDPMADPYVQRLMQVMAMPGLQPEQRAVVQLQLQTRIDQLSGGGDGFTLSPGQQRFDAQGNVIAQAAPKEGAGTAEYGLTPQFITTPEGGLQMIQLSKDGTAKVVDLPEGAAIQKGVEKLDLGTAFQWYNTITGEPIGQPIPKDLRAAEAEKAAGSVEGKASAERAIAAPDIIAKAQDTKDLIDSILVHPALGSVVGNLQGRLPAGIPVLTGGQAGADVGVKLKQLKGKAFLEAFETLKGGGQITEREGQAATEAMARLDRAQSEPEYRAALMELQEIAGRAVLRAQGKLGVEAAPPAAPAGNVMRFDADGNMIQ